MAARQDFPPIPNGANVPGGWGHLHARMCDEIDRLGYLSDERRRLVRLGQAFDLVVLSLTTSEAEMPMEFHDIINRVYAEAKRLQ